MRRFLVSYQYNVGRGFGFGSIFNERPDDTLPDPEAIAGIRESVAQQVGTSRDQVIVLAISEISADGPVVT